MIGTRCNVDWGRRVDHVLPRQRADVGHRDVRGSALPEEGLTLAELEQCRRLRKKQYQLRRSEIENAHQEVVSSCSMAKEATEVLGSRITAFQGLNQEVAWSRVRELLLETWGGINKARELTADWMSGPLESELAASTAEVHRAAWRASFAALLQFFLAPPRPSRASSLEDEGEPQVKLSEWISSSPADGDGWSSLLRTVRQSLGSRATVAADGLVSLSDNEGSDDRLPCRSFQLTGGCVHLLSSRHCSSRGPLEPPEVPFSPLEYSFGVPEKRHGPSRCIGLIRKPGSGGSETSAPLWSLADRLAAAGVSFPTPWGSESVECCTPAVLTLSASAATWLGPAMVDQLAWRQIRHQLLGDGPGDHKKNHSPFPLASMRLFVGLHSGADLEGEVENSADEATLDEALVGPALEVERYLRAVYPNPATTPLGETWVIRDRRKTHRRTLDEAPVDGSDFAGEMPDLLSVQREGEEHGGGEERYAFLCTASVLHLLPHAYRVATARNEPDDGAAAARLRQVYGDIVNSPPRCLFAEMRASGRSIVVPVSEAAVLALAISYGLLSPAPPVELLLEAIQWQHLEESEQEQDMLLVLLSRDEPKAKISVTVLHGQLLVDEPKPSIQRDSPAWSPPLCAWRSCFAPATPTHTILGHQFCRCCGVVLRHMLRGIDVDPGDESAVRDRRNKRFVELQRYFPRRKYTTLASSSSCSSPAPQASNSTSQVNDDGEVMEPLLPQQVADASWLMTELSAGKLQQTLLSFFKRVCGEPHGMLRPCLASTTEGLALEGARSIVDEEDLGNLDDVAGEEFHHIVDALQRGRPIARNEVKATRGVLREEKHVARRLRKWADAARYPASELAIIHERFQELEKHRAKLPKVTEGAAWGDAFLTILSRRLREVELELVRHSFPIIETCPIFNSVHVEYLACVISTMMQHFAKTKHQIFSEGAPV